MTPRGVSYAATTRMLDLPARAFKTQALEWPLQRIVLHTAIWQVLGLIWLAIHVAVVAQLGPIGGAVTLLIPSIVFSAMPLSGLLVFLQVLLYQNWVISLMSAGLSEEAFRFLQGTGFFVAALMTSQSMLRLTSKTCRYTGTGRLALFAVTVLVVALGYTALGAMLSSVGNAVVGFRNATAVLMATIIGLHVGRSWGYRTIAIGFVLSVFFGLALTVAEIAAPVEYYRLTGAVDFMNLKTAGAFAYADFFRSAEAVVASRESSLFNTTLLSTDPGSVGTISFRFGGPNMHPISYAYVLAVAAVAAATLRQYWMVPLFGSLIVMTGVKGALIVLAVATLLQILWSSTRRRKLVLAAGVVFAACYVGIGIPLGLSAGDYHVIGFLGGVKGFTNNPLGHGLGLGGNLSQSTFTERDWQDLGKYGIDYGLESAVGVLIYQMGIGSLAVLLFFVRTLRAMPFGRHFPRPGSNPTDILLLAAFVAIVNGIFQEEAYSPYALGLLMLLCGVVIGNHSSPAPTHAAMTAARHVVAA